MSSSSQFVHFLLLEKAESTGEIKRHAIIKLEGTHRNKFF